MFSAVFTILRKGLRFMYNKFAQNINPDKKLSYIASVWEKLSTMKGMLEGQRAGLLFQAFPSRVLLNAHPSSYIRMPIQTNKQTIILPFAFFSNLFTDLRWIQYPLKQIWSIIRWNSIWDVQKSCLFAKGLSLQQSVSNKCKLQIIDR